jgi:DNA-binding MarR family transcriptional regulator
MTEPYDAARVLRQWMGVFTQRSVHEMLQFTRESGLSLAQVNILMWLHFHKPCEVTLLAEAMQVSKAASSQMVERMVQQGLVQRLESARDRRAREVHLTERGRQVVEDTIHAREAWIDELVEDLTLEQKSALVNLLEDLIQKVPPQDVFLTSN